MTAYARELTRLGCCGAVGLGCGLLPWPMWINSLLSFVAALAVCWAFHAANKPTSGPKSP